MGFFDLKQASTVSLVIVAGALATVMFMALFRVTGGAFAGRPRVDAAPGNGSQVTRSLANFEINQSAAGLMVWHAGSP